MAIKELFKSRLERSLRDLNVPEHGQAAWLARKMDVTDKAAQKWLDPQGGLPNVDKWEDLAAAVRKPRAYFYEIDGDKDLPNQLKSLPESSLEFMSQYGELLEQWDERELLKLTGAIENLLVKK